ncbi:MAG: sulfatase-like hydrolase/transferase [Pedobacter sp.]|nr:sulfatase-like hydrolase/transferase [Pedobacter sp.]
MISYPFLFSNSYAESSDNRYPNELSKTGIYSFFFAFKNNELHYYDFYSLVLESELYKIMRDQLINHNSHFVSPDNSIRRKIIVAGKSFRPNVVMIAVESLSADFLAHFGSTQKLTSTLDSLADQGLLFSNMYATGTRTFRGMEALSLSIPPTPGNSIVRRQDNQKLLQGKCAILIISIYQSVSMNFKMIRGI